MTPTELVQRYRATGRSLRRLSTREGFRAQRARASGQAILVEVTAALHELRPQLADALHQEYLTLCDLTHARLFSPAGRVVELENQLRAIRVEIATHLEFLATIPE